ncbi:MAG TPA: hypothetical protein VIJ70_02540 [Gaiellaceae bacterium]
MKKAVLAVVALVVAALAITAGAALADNVRFGVNDDEGMFEKGTGPFFANLTALGMHDNTVTVRWDETTPTGFEDLGGGVTLQAFLPKVVATAAAAGVSLTFDVYPRHSLAAGDPADNAPKFAAWLKTLALTYPTVTHYVVMNECNQPLFVSPQYDANGNLLSAADCGQFLAAGYQALKSINPGIFVWGLGLSPHGAKVDGTVHRDADPFSFLAALGTWYRSSPYSGRPLMDGLDLHPYPIPQSTPFSQGNSNAYGPAYGVATLPLVYQAFYNAFNGTSQATVGPGRLPVSLNEVGIQTVPSVAGYTGTETANWGIDSNTGSEDYQAQWYKQLIDAAQCDADITNVNIFKLIDQADLGAWQSGLYQLGWLAKKSASVVQAELANVTSCPTGTAAYWQPAAGSAAASGATSLNGTILGPLTSYFPSLSSGLASVIPPEILNLFETINLRFTDLLNQFATMLGVAPAPLNGQLTLLLAQLPARTTSSAQAAKPVRGRSVVTRSFKVAKGKKVVFPMLGKVPAGRYTLKIVVRPTAGGAPATIITPAFNLNAQGKIVKSLKPAKKAKHKAKVKHKAKSTHKAKKS